MPQALVEIKKPCQQPLETKKPGQEGNYCRKCQTTVIDFRDKTPGEIARYFSEHKQQHLCGIFNEEHVVISSPIEHFLNFLTKRNLKYLAVFLFGFFVLVGCRTRKTTTGVYGSTRQLDEKTESVEHLK